MKTCTKCWSEKNADEFHSDKSAKDGLRRWCKRCGIDNARAWNASNKERFNQNKRRHQAKHPERTRNRQRSYRSRNRSTVNAKHRAWWHRRGKHIMTEAQRRARRNYQYKKLYGMSLDEVRALVASQKGRCAICRDPIDVDDDNPTVKAHVDHCHKTGRIREARCRGCNHGIGSLKDRPEIARAAAEYLDKHAQEALRDLAA